MSAISSPLAIDAINAAYGAALAAGRLTLQRCACGHRFMPARAACPACLGTHWTWETAQGSGRLKSWVVYHTAFHEAFRARLPYNVALVELDEGPRLITNILADHALLSADARVRFVAVPEGERTLARFALVP
jgi:uncharacterized OB-fold protein